MLQFTAAGPGRRFMLIVHHDDAEREVRLRPAVAHRQARPCLGRGEDEGLDRRQHEERLEDDFLLSKERRHGHENGNLSSLVAALALACTGIAQAQQKPTVRPKKTQHPRHLGR